ncbi:hypothetical protein [Kitasatospora sp. NPDC058478]|uniref:hypothetical protein n=1 Tax=unclassified Kitasatospora TaxID=2633591 RepID=UPI003655084E
MLDLATPRNAASARRALARVEELELTPLGPYPGSDVHWHLRCGRTGCDWTGYLFYSHLRASRGHNRRHVGCTGTPGTYSARLADTDLAQRLADLFPDTEFTITTPEKGRTVTWTGHPDGAHLAALIGDSQGILLRRLPPDSGKPST